MCVTGIFRVPCRVRVGARARARRLCGTSGVHTLHEGVHRYGSGWPARGKKPIFYYYQREVRQNKSETQIIINLAWPEKKYTQSYLLEAAKIKNDR